MAYVYIANLTDAYIQSLIARNGYTDVTAQHPDDYGLYKIQDLEGNVYGFGDMDAARRWLITEYDLLQNG